MIKLDNVPTLNRGGKKIYDWKNSIGCMITCINDKTNESIEAPIVRYENRIIYVLVYKKEIPVSTIHIENCKCGKIFRTYTPEYKYEVGDIIGNRKIIKRYKAKSQMKFYEWKCIDCGHIGNIQEQKMSDFENNNHRCPIPFTDSWMIPYFQGRYKEAMKYTKYSNKKIYPVCPICHNISRKAVAIKNIAYTHSIGCICTDNISYPEKFFYNFLEQIGIDFEWQYIIEGNNRLYDFYIPSLNMICEVHGEQHYTENNFGRSLDREQLNDIQKEEYAMLQGYKYCIIDARKSKMEWMKENIISSSIYLELNCPKIDWLKCERAATGSIIYDVCKYINENPDCKYDKVAEYFHITENRVKEYSKRGVELFGWYEHKEKRYTGKIHTVKIYYKNKEITTISDSYNGISKYLQEEYNVDIKRREIQHICDGEYFSNKGYHFELIA